MQKRAKFGRCVFANLVMFTASFCLVEFSRISALRGKSTFQSLGVWLKILALGVIFLASSLSGPISYSGAASGKGSSETICIRIGWLGTETVSTT